MNEMLEANSESNTFVHVPRIDL